MVWHFNFAESLPRHRIDLQLDRSSSVDYSVTGNHWALRIEAGYNHAPAIESHQTCYGPDDVGHWGAATTVERLLSIRTTS